MRQPQGTPFISTSYGMASTFASIPASAGSSPSRHRSKRQGAVAAHDCCHAVVAGERAKRVEGHLAVVVGVVVDESGSDNTTARVDLARCRAVQSPHGGDTSVHDTEVSDLRSITRTVDHEAALDE